MKRILLLCLVFLTGATLLQAAKVKPPVWNALIVSYAVPDSFVAGKPTTVTFTMQNTGTTIWKPDTVWLRINLDSDNSTTDIALTNSVYPGKQYVFTKDLILGYNTFDAFRPGPRQTGLNEGLNCVDLA